MQSFDGLQGLVSDALGQDPPSGHLFLFVNRRRDKLKVHYWDGDGLAIWYRRLEHGTFQMPTITADKTTAEVNREDLIMLIRGLDYEQAQRRKRFQLKGSQATKVDQLDAT